MTTGRSTTSTRARCTILLAIAALVTACAGGSQDGQRQSGPSTTEGREAGPTPALTFPSTTAGPADEPKAAPRWVGVADFSGSGVQETGSFEIADHAIQWRVRWTCDAGDLRIGVLPEEEGDALVDSGCPQAGSGISIRSGPLRLRVEATGSWRATVEQQVETPAEEPPLAGMEAAPVLASGSLYEIDEPVEGTVTLYQMPDGGRALRFENFRVHNNVDLEIWLSEAPAPASSAEAAESPHVVLGPLTATIGPQNYVIPAEVGTDRIRSVVIWCPPILSAYAAATMTPPA